MSRLPRTISFSLLIGYLVWIALASTTGADAQPPKYDTHRMGAAPPEVHSAGHGRPWVNLTDGRPVPVQLPKASRAATMLDHASARPLALASADFDEDGIPDVVCSFAHGREGIVTIHRGNVDSIYPNSPEAKARRTAGTFVEAPFLPDARSFEIPERPDFIAAGDFDADGHSDLVAGARGGETLHLYPGDGGGGFGNEGSIALPGVLTALVSGEINRRDGLSDLVVGIDGPTGPRVLVYEGPDGALHHPPEGFLLRAPATDLSLVQLDGSGGTDLAVAAGEEVVIVYGRDRRLSHREDRRAAADPPVVRRQGLPFAIAAMATGDFDGDQQPDMALVDKSGNLHIASAHELQALSTGNGLDFQTTTTEVEAIEGIMEGELRDVVLTTARVSSLPGDDLLLIHRSGHRINLRMPHEMGGGSASLPGGDPRSSWVPFDVQGEPISILPMRLNSDALSDLVVLSEGSAILSTIQTEALTIFSVTNTNPTGTGSLEQAILDADANPGLDSITFNIPGPGPHTIQDIDGLPLLNDPVTIDANTEPDFAGSPVVEIDGTLAPVGLRATGGGITIRGLIINNYPSDGILLSGGGNNIIEGNYLGTDVTGLSAAGNGDAGVASQSGNITIGGTTAAARNIISGNGIAGVLIWTSDTGVVISGNYIGTTRTGTVAVANGGEGGVHILDGLDVTIGGSTAGSGNVISGNLAHGIRLREFGSGALIQGNKIGTNPAGTSRVGNGPGAGIDVNGSSNTIGGTTPTARNLISGNLLYGILVEDFLGSSADLNQIQGNYIGTNDTGMMAFGNTSDGIRVRARDNLVGGAVSGARNVISGNLSSGVDLGYGASGNDVFANYIGTNASGTGVLGNDLSGVTLIDAVDNRIGGASLATANVISGNQVGVWIVGSGATGNLIEVNLIGTNHTGAAVIANAMAGVIIQDAGPNMIGVKIGQGNVISGNAGDGVLIVNSFGITMQGNIIGLDATGDLAFPNDSYGIQIEGGSDHVIGGPTAGEGNIISGNGNGGVGILGSTLNKIQGNLIGVRALGDIARPNLGWGVVIDLGSANTVGGTSPDAGNLISGNYDSGIRISSSSYNKVQKNIIGPASDGVSAIGNGGAGIALEGGASLNLIGGTSAATGNVIAFNILEGVWVESGTSNGIRMNSMFLNTGLGIDLGSIGITPNDPGDADSGANLGQNFPVLSGVTTTGGMVSVTATLDSLASSSFDIDFYYSPLCDIYGYGEGQTPIGSGTMTTDATGIGTLTSSFTGIVPAGEILTATATDIDGNTSEFSACGAAVGVPPGAVTGMSLHDVGAGELSWDGIPGASSYHLFVGASPTLRNLASSASAGCELAQFPSPGIQLPPATNPPPGEMFWFMATAEGSYGEGPLQPGSGGIREMNSTGICGSSCAHNHCLEGDPLVPACTPCVSMICAAYPSCCDPVNGAWDAFCVDQVRDVCGSLTCILGQCAHPLCNTGVPLQPGCDQPPLAKSCTAAICQADPHCCQQAWDEACIAQMPAVCGYSCY